MMYPTDKGVTAVADSGSSDGKSPLDTSTNFFGSPSFPLIATSLGAAQACPKSFSAHTWMVYLFPVLTFSSSSFSSVVMCSFSSTSDCRRDRTLAFVSLMSVDLTETRKCEIGRSFEPSEVHVTSRSCSSLVRLSSMLLGALGIPISRKYIITSYYPLSIRG